ncbi:MAG: hypothetical protein ACRCXT_24210 [Paraclostridium sp.]
MTREEFNNLDITNQIEFINNELNTHKTITKVCKEHNLRRQTIQSWFLKAGYQFNDNEKQYTKVSNSTPTLKEPMNKITKIASKDKEKNNNTNTQENKIKSLECQIKGLEEEINNIYKLISSKGYTKVEDSTLDNVIHKDIEELQGTDTIARTYKLYKDIDIRLEEHIKANKKYKKQDIINSIFIDYLNKYKK